LPQIEAVTEEVKDKTLDVRNHEHEMDNI